MRIRPQYFFILAIFFSLALFSMSVFAANLYNVQYRIQPQTIGEASNHTIYFQSRTALSSGTIVLNLQNLISSTGSVTYADMDLSYGVSATATQTQLTLGAVPGNAIWGAAIDSVNKRITFTYPSSGSGTILADQVITIKIGTHATQGGTGTQQLTNAATTGEKLVSIVAGNEVGVISVPLVTSAVISAGATAPVQNTAPVISITNVVSTAATQSASSYVTISYTGTDEQNNTASLVSYQYSRDGATWTTMTQKSGSGNSTTNLAFTSGGAAFTFVWDSATDIPNTQSNTISVRLKANDGTIDGDFATSNTFSVDTNPPASSAAVIAPAPAPTQTQTSETQTQTAQTQTSETQTQTAQTQTSETQTQTATKTTPEETKQTETEKPPIEEKKDTTPPVSSINIQGTVGQNNWYTSAVVISLSAIDTETPNPVVYYRIGTSGDFLLYKTPLTISTEGEKTIQYYASDALGNKETQKSFLSRIDTLAPTGSAILNNGKLSTNIRDVPLTLQCKDGGSLCATVALSQNNTSWTAWQIIRDTSTVQYTSDGKKILYIKFRDAAGNESQSITLSEILIDTIPPTLLTDITSKQNPGEEKTIKAVASDALSSVASFQWAVTQQPTNGDLVIDNPTSQTIKVSATEPGTYVLSITITDAAGNKTTSSDTKIVILDPNKKLTVQELKQKNIDIKEAPKTVTENINPTADNVVSSERTTVTFEAGTIDTTIVAQSAFGRPLATVEASQIYGGGVSGGGGGISGGEVGGVSGVSSVSGGGGGFVLQPAAEQGQVKIELSKLPCTVASETVGTDILAVSPPGTKLMGCAVDRVIANYELKRKTTPSQTIPSSQEQSLLIFPAQSSLSFGERILDFFKHLDSMPAFAQEKLLPQYPIYQRIIPITEFQKKPTLTFLYTQKEASSVYVDTVRLFAWDPEENKWVPEEEVEHKQEENAVIAKVDHLSLFGLFAEPIPLPRRLKEEVVYTASAGQFEQPKTLLENQDLGLTETATKKQISFADHEFYVPTQADLDMCLAARLFQQRPVKKITLSNAGERITLLYDKSKACYAGHFQAPQKKGSYDVVLKIIYGDDVTQTIALTMITATAVQAQVLAAVAPPIKEVQKAAIIVNTETKKAVEISEPALQASVAVSVPAVAVANPAIAMNAVQWWYYINYIFSWILSSIGLKKRRKPWGVVYDAITKNPLDLAIVRLIDTKTKKLIETQVTDKNGRFSFVPIPGEYTVTATKQEFLFPSKIVTEIIDGDYFNVYHQETVTVKSAEDTIQLSIPLDQKAPATFHAKTFKTVAKEFTGKYALVSLVVSMTISIALTTYVPSTLNAVLLLINSVFIMSQVMLMAHEQKPWGIVFNALNLKPVPLAAIAIFDAKQQKLLRSRLTDYYGRFNFLAPTGEFILSVSKEQYAFPAHKELHVRKYKHLYFGGTIQVKKGNEIVRTNIPLEEKAIETVAPASIVPATPLAPAQQSSIDSQQESAKTPEIAQNTPQTQGTPPS